MNLFKMGMAILIAMGISTVGLAKTQQKTAVRLADNSSNSTSILPAGDAFHSENQQQDDTSNDSGSDQTEDQNQDDGASNNSGTDQTEDQNQGEGSSNNSGSDSEDNSYGDED